MIIDMAVLGAIGLASGALSAGNHIISNKRLRKLERENKIKTAEITVLEVSVLSSIGAQLVDKWYTNKRIKEIANTGDAMISQFEHEIQLLHARIDALKIDDVAYQNEVINAKVDHISNVIDIAAEESDIK